MVDDAGLAALLLDWRKKCLYNQETDHVFASAETHGKQPLRPSSAMSKHIWPAAKKAGIVKHVRWKVLAMIGPTWTQASQITVASV